MKLIIPTIDYKESFIAAVKEFQQEDLSHVVGIMSTYDLDMNYLDNSFGKYIETIKSQSRGENLPHGYVPQTILWLVDNNEYIGKVSLRHELTDYLLKYGGHIGYDIRKTKRSMGYGSAILKLALEEAKKMSLSKVLITCNETNIGSKRIIEKNGGGFENKVLSSDGITMKLRYWIDL